MKQLLFLLIFLPLTLASQVYSGKQKVMDPNRSIFSFFGHTVEISNDYAFVAAPESPYDTAGVNPIGQSGIVLVYKRNPNGRWDLFQKLQSSSRNLLGQFGWSMAAQDSILVVGARGEDLGFVAGGAAHIFKLAANGRWQHQQRIIPNDTAYQGRFGESVAIDWPYIIVGAEKNDLDSANANAWFDAGAAYIFERQAGQWLQADKLSASQGRVSSAYFGRSVAIHGDRALVGAPRGIVSIPGVGNLGFGAVYEYQRQPSGLWIEKNIIVDTLGSSWGGDFGHRVELADSLAIISALFRSYDTVISAGEVVVMRRNGNSWQSIQYLHAVFPFDNDRYGSSLDFDGSQLIIGADSEDHDVNNQNPITSAGSAFLYDWNSSADSMVFRQKILPQDRLLPNSTFDFFGADVAVDAGYLLVGARNDDDDTANVTQTNAAGTAYFFDSICPVKSGSLSTSICPGDSLLFNGQYYNQAGSYSAVLTAIDGCDSVVSLTLNTLPASNDSLSVSSCDSYLSPSGKGPWTSSGQYLDTLQSSNGCDSLVYIDLTILPVSDTALSISSCFFYDLPGSGTRLTTSGQYYDTLSNSLGCDSVLDINLLINTVDTGLLVDQNNMLLFASASNATFRWLDCDNGYAVIPGANNDSMVFQPGTYAVEISQNGCVDTSRCAVIKPISITEYYAGASIKVYPNPSSGSFTMEVPQAIELKELSLRAPDGRILYYFPVFTGSGFVDLNLPDGMYYLIGYMRSGDVLLSKVQIRH